MLPYLGVPGTAMGVTRALCPATPTFCHGAAEGWRECGLASEFAHDPEADMGEAIVIAAG